MLLDEIKAVSVEELIRLVRSIKVEEELKSELRKAVQNFYDLNPSQQRLVGGLVAGLIHPSKRIDFLGFGRENLKLEGLDRVGDCACIYSKNCVMSNIIEVGGSAFVFSENGSLINVRRAGDYLFASSTNGLVYEVGSAGRYAFFDAENIVAFLGFVEEIYDPKSGIIVAQGVGRV